MVIMVKFCTECGYKNEDISKFCVNCGHPFKNMDALNSEDVNSEDLNKSNINNESLANEESKTDKPEELIDTVGSVVDEKDDSEVTVDLNNESDESKKSEDIEELIDTKKPVTNDKNDVSEETKEKITNVIEENNKPEKNIKDNENQEINDKFGVKVNSYFCPVCEKKSLNQYKKNGLIKNSYTYYCPDCGLKFSKNMHAYNLKDIENKDNAVWLKYNNQSLTKDEWYRIFKGGISDKEQKVLDKEAAKKLKLKREGEEKVRKEKIKQATNVLPMLIPKHPELLKPITTSSIILKRGEIAYLDLDNVILLEPRAVRTSTGGYGGGSVRVAKGVNIRLGGAQGQSSSRDVLTQIDSGKLILTNKRIVYTGKLKSSNIPFSKIMNLTTYSDALKVQIESRAKPQYFKDTDKSVKSFKYTNELVNVKLTSSILKAMILTLMEN
jgi:predicted amidophosphoribosyltransferase